MKEKTVRIYDKEFKLNAIRLYLNGGRSYPQVSSELGIPVGTLVTWVRSYKTEGADALKSWLYIAAIMDLFSRRIVGLAMSDRMNDDLVIAAL